MSATEAEVRRRLRDGDGACMVWYDVYGWEDARVIRLFAAGEIRPCAVVRVRTEEAIGADCEDPAEEPALHAEDPAEEPAPPVEEPVMALEAPSQRSRKRGRDYSQLTPELYAKGWRMAGWRRHVVPAIDTPKNPPKAVTPAPPSPAA